MRQGGEPQGVQVVRQGESTPYHCDFNPLYLTVRILVERIQKQPVPLVSPKCRLLFAVRLLFNDGRSRRALVVNSNVVCD